MFDSTRHRNQFVYLLIQVFLVGMAIGCVRTVLPVIADSEYQISDNSLIFVASIVIAFGFIKSISNVLAGLVSDIVGRKKVLIAGWLIALPIPLILLITEVWIWIIIALILLGIHQGLTWSMTQSSKIDITHTNRHGYAMGLNEFSGYIGVALAGALTATIAEIYDPKFSLFLIMTLVVLLGLHTSIVAIIETKKSVPQTKSETDHTSPRMYVKTNTWSLILLVSWKDKRLMALCQAGLIEKFVDSLIWIFFPIFLYQKGLTLTEMGWVVSCYGIVWGVGQLFSGWVSDQLGRKLPIVSGMLLCSVGVLMNLINDGVIWWSFCSVITGVGMALLYPTLSSAVVDFTTSEIKGSALGIYRFWRDLGYGISGLLFGVLLIVFDQIAITFIFVAISMIISTTILMYYLPNYKITSDIQVRQ